MTAPPKDLSALLEKLERADKHIFDFQELRDAWKEGEEERVGFKDDPNTGERTYYFTSIPPISDKIPPIIGDAIHNIRSALDHLAHRLVTVGKDSTGPFNHVYFPIFINSEKYKTDAKAKIEGARPEAIEAIDGIEPYGGGAGEIFWQLHTLDIMDKHKLLIPIASANIRQSMPPSRMNGIKRAFFGDVGHLTSSEMAHAFLSQSTGVSYPLKARAILRVVPKPEVNEDMYFPLEIAFGEPETLAGNSVLETLHRMKSEVRNMIMVFDEKRLLDSN